MKSKSENTALLSTNDGNDGNDAFPAAAPVQPVQARTNKLSPGYFVWAFFASILVTPLAFLCLAIDWLLVFSIPMAKTHWKLIKAVYMRPLDISIEKEYGLNAQSQHVILCTYNAYSVQYVHYSFMGMNIFLVNLFPILFLIVILSTILHKIIPDDKQPPKPAQFFFFLSCCIPITFYIGMAISCIAAQTNYMIGALLNATFGSMTELILYSTAIAEGGLDELVKYSVTGGLLSDTLLLPGLSMIAGGIKYKDQKFNPVAAGASSLLLFIAVVGIFSPTIWYSVYGGYDQTCKNCMMLAPMLPNVTETEVDIMSGTDQPYNITEIVCRLCYNSPVFDLDVDDAYQGQARKLIYFCAAILPIAYVIGLVFTFFTHSHIFKQDDDAEEEDLPSWGLPFAIIFMMTNTIMFGLLAELIVFSVKPTLEAVGIPQSFLGLTLIALVPATTEVVNAIKFALVNQISLSVEIGSASAIQIALIQVPFLIIISAIMNGVKTANSFVLIFPLLTVFAVILAVMTSHYIAAEGRTSYFTGVSICIIYFIFIASFWFVPTPDTGDKPHHFGNKHNVMMSVSSLGPLRSG